MSKVVVEQAHTKGVEGARGALESFEEMIGKYGMKTTWKGSNAVLKGIGASGSIKVGATSVSVEVKLGMMAKAAGVDPVRLEQSIRKRLVAALGD